MDQASVDRDEVARFSALAAEWWDPNGKLAPLHKLNPVRIAFIRDALVAQFGRDPGSVRALAGLGVLDIGCGGGLAAEPLARLGAAVSGIDASAEGLEAARRHAQEGGLAIDYRQASAEDLAAEGSRFDAVLALEIVEHVADVEAFLGACCRLVRPDGALILGTLNRTPQSFALGIVAAEYLLRWLPPGTHDWRRFLRPSELAAILRRHGFQLRELAGISYDPLQGTWRRSRDLSINYLALATR